jgi:hypothetical protein
MILAQLHVSPADALLVLRGHAFASGRTVLEGELDETDAVAVRALADVATISVLQERALRDGVAVRAQLRRALDTRVVIEQAKGVIAYTHHADMDAAFRIIREHARSVRMSLSDVAAGIVDSTISITAARPPRP